MARVALIRIKLKRERIVGLQYEPSRCGAAARDSNPARPRQSRLVYCEESISAKRLLTLCGDASQKRAVLHTSAKRRQTKTDYTSSASFSSSASIAASSASHC